MKTEIHKSHNRGHFDIGWLQTWHSFSFSNYYNPSRMNFGALRVLNDDIIQPGRGFGMHPHDNMEIITIPLQGSLMHRDNMGGEGIIKTGSAQYMCAGSGIVHSEFNPSDTEISSLYQIWIEPNKRNVEPRYSQFDYSNSDYNNKFLPIVSPGNIENTIMINQDAYIYLTKLNKSKNINYEINNKNSGVFIFLTSGVITVEETLLNRRDAIACSETEKIFIEANEDSEILLLEIPLIN